MDRIVYDSAVVGEIIDDLQRAKRQVDAETDLLHSVIDRLRMSDMVEGDEFMEKLMQTLIKLEQDMTRLEEETDSFRRGVYSVSERFEEAERRIKTRLAVISPVTPETKGEVRPIASNPTPNVFLSSANVGINPDWLSDMAAEL